MDKFHLHWFTDEISIHASTAIAAYEHLQQLLNNPATVQSRIVWISITSFLTHSAMVSKFLNPIRGGDNELQRAIALRDHLNIPENSPILARNARDNLEHFDERIDRWVNTNKTKVIEMVFSDRDGFSFLYSDDCAIRRALIADELVFISEDRNGNPVEFALEPVYSAIVELSYICNHKLQTESPYHYLLAQALRTSN